MRSLIISFFFHRLCRGWVDGIEDLLYFFSHAWRNSVARIPCGSTFSILRDGEIGFLSLLSMIQLSRRDDFVAELGGARSYPHWRNALP